MKVASTHVTYQYTPRPVQAPLIGMLQEIEHGAELEGHHLESEMKPAPGDIRGEMGLNNESVLHLRRVRERDGLKFGLYTGWTPESPCRATPAFSRPRPGSVFPRERT